LLEGVCGMPIQLHAFRRAAAPPLNFHGFRIYNINNCEMGKKYQRHIVV
jgi:hypothetical protein